jgi:hypothetical protein
MILNNTTKRLVKILVKLRNIITELYKSLFFNVDMLPFIRKLYVATLKPANP